LHEAAAATLGLAPDALLRSLTAASHGGNASAGVLRAAAAAALDPCAAAGASAAIHCGALRVPGAASDRSAAAHVAALEGCAHALHTLSTPRCRSPDAKHGHQAVDARACVRAAVSDAMSAHCSASCGSALLAASEICGGFVPRASLKHIDSDDKAHACSATVAAVGPCTG
jgi:hypothetical protein